MNIKTKKDKVVLIHGRRLYVSEYSKPHDGYVVNISGTKSINQKVENFVHKDVRPYHNAWLHIMYRRVHP